MGGREQGHLQERVMTLEAAAHCYDPAPGSGEWEGAGAGTAPAPLRLNSYFSAQVRIEGHLKKIIIILPSLCVLTTEKYF